MSIEMQIHKQRDKRNFNQLAITDTSTCLKLLANNSKQYWSYFLKVLISFEN